MTPEEALAKLEGRIRHKSSSKENLNEIEILTGIDAVRPKKDLPRVIFEEKAASRLNEIKIQNDRPAVSVSKAPYLMILLLTVLLGLMLMTFYLWKINSDPRDAYKKGYHDGVNALNSNFTSEQTNINDYTQEIDQLHQKLMTSGDNLEKVVQQRDSLLKELRGNEGKNISEIDQMPQPAAEGEGPSMAVQNDLKAKASLLTAAGFKQVAVRVSTLLLYSFPEINFDFSPKNARNG